MRPKLKPTIVPKTFRLINVSQSFAQRKLFFLPYLSSTRLGLMDLMKQNKQFELISARLNSGFACRKSSTNQSTTMATPTQ